jgi:hypothetical protein
MVVKRATSIRFRFPVEKYPRETAILSKAINLLPKEVLEYLVENPIMFSAEIEIHRANSLCISHDSFKKEKYLIHLNYHIWKYPEEEIIKTIFHEIAHVYLGHETLSNVPDSKSSKYISKIENEADRLMNKWYNNILKSNKK